MLREAVVNVHVYTKPFRRSVNAGTNIGGYVQIHAERDWRSDRNY